MTWYLYAGNPGRLEVPLTHRVTGITHGEFKKLANYLESYLLGDNLVVDCDTSAVILRRITGFNVRTAITGGARPDLHRFPQLQPEDFVLAFLPRISGMHIALAYLKADDAHFKEIVGTWLIEPNDSKLTEPVRLRALAHEVAVLNKRIASVSKALLECTDEKMSEVFRELLDKYCDEKVAILSNPLMNLDKISRLTDLYSNAAKSLERERLRVSAKLKVERGIDNESKELTRTLEGIARKSRLYAEAIYDLKIACNEL